MSAPIGPPNGADECTIDTTSSSHTANGHQTRLTSRISRADGGEDDQDPLDRKVVEVPGVLHDRVEQRPLLALVRDERVPDDDLGLLQHAEELRQQQQHCRHADEQQA